MEEKKTQLEFGFIRKLYANGKIRVYSETPEEYSSVFEKALNVSLEILPNFNVDLFKDTCKENGVPEEIVRQFLDRYRFIDDTYLTMGERWPG